MVDGSEKVAIPHLLEFVSDCFSSVGVSKAHSDIMASTIVEADKIGHRSNGVYRLKSWILEIQSGMTDSASSPKIEKETSATAWVDGQNSLGPVVGDFCMKLAIQKAKKVGAAIVIAKYSNNLGALGLYSHQASKEGMLGWCCSNSTGFMVPTRARYANTGTNPISFGAPGVFGDFFLLDMSTTVASGRNIQIKAHEGKYLPKGWAMNAACLPETNADVAALTMRYLPLGSDEHLGSYKGTGLSIMVDILCGILSGSLYGPNVGVWKTKLIRRKAANGHCFIAIDPARFAPNFGTRLTALLNQTRNVEPMNPQKPVIIPGDRSRKSLEESAETCCLEYPRYVVESVQYVANMLQVKCVHFIPKITSVFRSPSEDLAIRLEEMTKAEEAEVIHEIPSTEELEEITKKNIEQSFIVGEDSWDWLTAFDEEEEKKKDKDNI